MPVKKIVFYIMCGLLVVMLIVGGITIAKAGTILQGLLNPAPPAATEPASTTATTEATEPTGTINPTDSTEDETDAPTNAPTDSEHQHSYSVYKTSPATCTEDGYTIYKCDCGDTETRDFVDALGHTFGAGQQFSSCTEENYTQFECSVCKFVEKRNVTPASGHNFDQEETFPATCDDDAYTVRTCSNPNCNETETVTEDGSALGHDYKLKEEVSATCTEKGYKLFTCANPGCTADPIKEEIAPLGGHNFVWANGVAACTNTGCNDTIRFEQLSITKQEHIDNVYIIIVGTGTGESDIHKLYSYTIDDERGEDEQELHPLEFKLEKNEGLVVLYTRADGQQEKVALGFKDNSKVIEAVETPSEIPTEAPTEASTETPTETSTEEPDDLPASTENNLPLG